MTVNFTEPGVSTRHPGPVPPPGRPGVPWSTVLPLAVVMAYADGFWTATVRGAVGAIERTQSPFASWWRESTAVLPVFVLAVLGALTLTVRWFGPGPGKPRTVLAAALLTAAAGTITGITLVAVSTAYDYHLESGLLAMMNSMHGLCTGSCLAQAQQATIDAQITAVLYAGGLILLTNLVLIGWMVAMRGGRLKTSTVKQPRISANRLHRYFGGQLGHMRLLLVAGLLGSAAIHAAVIPNHLTEWPAAGVFFLLLTAAQIAVAGTAVLATGQRLVVLAASAISLGLIALWLYSRTAGMPFGPAAGIPEPVGLPDCAAGILELAALLAAINLIRSPRRPVRRRPATPHLRAIAVTALITVTVLGLAGTTPNWLDNAGSPTVMNSSH